MVEYTRHFQCKVIYEEFYYYGKMCRSQIIVHRKRIDIKIGHWRMQFQWKHGRKSVKDIVQLMMYLEQVNVYTGFLYVLPTSPGSILQRSIQAKKLAKDFSNGLSTSEFQKIECIRLCCFHEVGFPGNTWR